MKKFLIFFMFLCSCSVKQNDGTDCSVQSLAHNIDIRHVNIDSLREIVLNKHGYMTEKDLGLRGLTIDDCALIFGKDSTIYWLPEIIKDSLEFPDGYEDAFGIKNYPVEIVAYCWSRDDTMDLCLHFVKERDTFVVIDAIQAKKEALKLE